MRWQRCLRCDDWVQRLKPERPCREHVESRDEIRLPVRGAALRDRYVLRLIALDRAIHVVVLTSLAIVLFTFAPRTIRYCTTTTRTSWTRWQAARRAHPSTAGSSAPSAGPSSTAPRHTCGSSGAYLLAALEATEMVGLWLNKRWAEYLTFIATTVLVPYEVYELTLSVSVFKLVTLAINLAVVHLLLFAKRLFGLRGGHRADDAPSSRAAGAAIERATPAPVA